MRYLWHAFQEAGEQGRGEARAVKGQSGKQAGPHTIFEVFIAKLPIRQISVIGSCGFFVRSSRPCFVRAALIGACAHVLVCVASLVAWLTRGRF